MPDRMMFGARMRQGQPAKPKPKPRSTTTDEETELLREAYGERGARLRRGAAQLAAPARPKAPAPAAPARPKAPPVDNRPIDYEGINRAVMEIRREDSARVDSMRKGSGRFRKRGRFDAASRIFKRFFPE